MNAKQNIAAEVQLALPEFAFQLLHKPQNHMSSTQQANMPSQAMPLKRALVVFSWGHSSLPPEDVLCDRVPAVVQSALVVEVQRKVAEELEISLDNKLAARLSDDNGEDVATIPHSVQVAPAAARPERELRSQESAVTELSLRHNHIQCHEADCVLTFNCDSLAFICALPLEHSYAQLRHHLLLHSSLQH